MELPRLSVVLPNYNHSAYLPAALNGLLRQSASPFEVIVIDDASTDKSMEVINEFARKHPVMRVYQNEKNQGVVFGLNRGLGLAKGDYVFFTSADDEVVPGFFEKSLGLLAKYPQAALSCTVSQWRYMDSGLTWHMGVGMADGPAFLSPEELVRVGKRGKLIICTSSVIMKKAPLVEVGGFLQELRWHCDWFATMAAALRYGLCYVPEPLSLFNIHSQSYYQSGHRKGEHRQVLLKLMELLNSPDFADVRPRVRESGALSLFAIPMLRILLERREYWDWINLTLVRRTLRRSAELQAKKILPVWLARWFLKRFYRLAPKRDRQLAG